MSSAPAGGRGLMRAALDIVADNWTILMLRELFMGARQWSDFTIWLNIPPATLNARLKQLVRAECIAKDQASRGGAPSYELTEKGRDLFPVQMAMREWQLRWHPREGAWVTPWVHACGHPLRCHTVCHACGKTLQASEIKLSERSPTLSRAGASTHQSRVSSVTGPDRRSSSLQAARVIEIWGDRCSTLIMTALLRGRRKFDEIDHWTGLPPATLARRLRKLQMLGLVHMRLYQERPDRYEYYPSVAGSDLFAPTLELYRWAERWLARQSGPFATHTTCGQPLVADLLCQHCNGPVSLDNTQLDPSVMARVG